MSNQTSENSFNPSNEFSHPTKTPNSTPLDCTPYIAHICHLLENVDLDTTSIKSIREALAREYPTLNVQEHKKSLNSVIMEQLERLVYKKGTSSSSSLKKRKREKRDDMDVDVDTTRIEIVSVNDANVKNANRESGVVVNDANVKNESVVVDNVKQTTEEYSSDAAFARRLSSTLNAPRSRRSTHPLPKPHSRKKKSDNSVKDTHSKDTLPKKNKAFHKLFNVSLALQAITGTASCSRPEVIKHLWTYIKAHNLQDEKDKRFIKCDQVMENVFGKKRVGMFKMNQLLGKSLFERDEVCGGVDDNKSGEKESESVEYDEKESMGVDDEKRYSSGDESE
jgi:upstream activation factor subunit UAF30